MGLNTTIHPAKKSLAAVTWAVNKVYITSTYVINKMGGVVAVAGAILAAVTAFTSVTVGKAADWIQDKLAKGIPIVMGFIAKQLGADKKSTIRKILENLT
jgi:hypothetical protein